MSQVLTGPVSAAAALLCVAAVAKLRAPAGAVRALTALGWPARIWHVRALCGLEMALGGAALLRPDPVPTAGLVALYAVFAGAAVLLRARQSACGCFGSGEVPASAIHVLLSSVLALVCAAGALWPAHRLAWTLTRPVLALGIAGCVYAAVLAYTQLPPAWGAWHPR